VRAEWSGAMRCSHRVWIHALARCGSAAAVAIARSNTSFGECRCGHTSDSQGGAYRTDHGLAAQIEPQLDNFSGASKFPEERQNGKSGTLSCATGTSERRRTASSELAQDRNSIDWEIALSETRQVAGAARQQSLKPRMPARPS